MNVFLDCGAHTGESVKKLSGVLYLPETYEIHSFEPNPVFWGQLEKLPVVLHKQAVWIKDGPKELYLARKNEGSTLLRDKITGYVDYGNPILVEAVDLGKWVKENFSETDIIVLKLDVEGAEIEILNHMLKDGSIDLIDTLFVEFHYKKIRSLRKEDCFGLIRKLQKKGLAVQKWP